MSGIRVSAFAGLSILFIASSTGCGSGVGGGPDFAVNLVNPVATAEAALAQFKSIIEDSPIGLGTLAVGDVGQSVNDGTTTDVVSFKYYIKEIRICESLNTTGTAYDSPTGCLSLYRNDTDDYDTFDSTAAAAAGADKYIDLMSKADLAKLKESPVPVQAGSYNFGVIDWYQPVKLTAKVTLDGGATTYKTPGGVGPVVDTISPAGDPQETITTLGNGGNWFKFQNPLELDGSTATTLDLVFNPHGLIFASTSQSNGQIRTEAGPGFMIPLLELTPVAHEVGVNAMKESYTITPTGGKVKLRLELYYVENNPGTVYGVDLKTLIIPGTTDESMLHPQKVSFISTSGDTLEFRDYQNLPMISNFARLTAVGAGANTLALTCANMMHHLAATVCGDSTASYTLDSITTVE